MTKFTTLTDDPEAPERGEDVAPKDLGLVIVWSKMEPERLGEIALVTTHGISVLGRAGEERDRARLIFFQQRPGTVTPTGDLASPRISREQLEVQRVPGESRLRVKNVGRCRLVQGGEEIAQTEVGPGECIELRGQLLLMCVERLAWMSEPPALRTYPKFEFGCADAHGMVGESPEAWRMREMAAFVARRAGHVLVRGESGTGKELMARALHALSPREKRPMVSRNAATLPEGLVDAELFGNARNYPNAGMEARPGLIGEADGSTLFLDEFAELPAGLQAHLLRVLDAGEYTRLGEPRPRRADFRLIAATNRASSAVKHDVLARLPFRIELPGLAERREDIPLLLRHMLQNIRRSDPEAVARFTGVSVELIKALLVHDFTTHARELETIVWQSILSSPGDTLEVPEGWADEPRARADEDSPAPEGDEAPAGDEALTPARIQACLDAHNGVIERAWRPLGLSSRHALARLIRKHRLELRRSPK